MAQSVRILLFSECMVSDKRPGGSREIHPSSSVDDLQKLNSNHFQWAVIQTACFPVEFPKQKCLAKQKCLGKKGTECKIKLVLCTVTKKTLDVPK